MVQEERSHSLLLVIIVSQQEKSPARIVWDAESVSLFKGLFFLSSLLLELTDSREGLSFFS